MNLNKIKIVAATEFTYLVRTKAFLISLILVPVFSLGMGLVQTFLLQKPDTKPRRFAVMDRAGNFYDVLVQNAQENVVNPGQKSRYGEGGLFIPVRADLQGRSIPEVRRELTAQVNRGALFAYVEIPEGLAKADPDESKRILYYSDTPSYYRLKSWISRTLNEEIRRRRYQALGLDSRTQARLERDVPVVNASSPPPEESGTKADGENKQGEAKQAKEVKEELKGIFSPLIPMLLLFFVVMLTAPQMMNAVMEERTTRISEVLLGSVSPFDLMMGKLLASTGVALLVSALYLGGGLSVASRFGYSIPISISQLSYFFLFLILAVLLHGSIYLSIGAVFNNPKDAQGLMSPMVLITMLPMLLVSNLMTDPSGNVAVWMSFFPPISPFIMCFRLASHPAPPLWQVGLSIFLTFGTMLFVVWAAGRIFRIGLLAQGKPPNLPQMVRWIFSK